ncbi:RagB/SusD family nutrient uptake outer membrane protein [Nubsella zeaxanthinifaciens]|uniref:RagB/SusD family nutrient uptake outer membrane protein n=1 Tax=Nubsella zeaxanthinifaciens TaxID=392412 RepID=UPI003CFF4422
MKKKFLILSFALGLLVSSCEKMVEVEPKNQISDKSALSTIVGYESLLNSVYSRLIAFNYYGRDFILLGDVMADNIYTELTYANGRYIGQNSNQVNSHYNIWTTAYAAINDANIIIQTIDASADNSPAALAKKPQIKAEALALRAMLYFDLARVYGYEPTNITTAGGGFDKSVPLRLKATLGLPDAEQTPRATVAQVYKSIEDDLRASIALFSSGATASTLRMNKGAAYGLLGKLYVYSGRWAEAVTELDNAMNTANTAARLAGAGQYVAAFKALPNPESLFELSINAATQLGGVTGSNESLYTYTHPNGYNGISTFGGQTVSDELRALFTTGDDRLGMIFQFGGSSAAPTPLFNWADKYSAARGAYADNPKVMRFADLLLLKAEALAGQTQYASAATVVTQLRAARNATGVTVPTDINVVNFIQQERRRELFFEGHRWFDLKRLAGGITKPAKTGVGTIVATDFKLLAPIPNAEQLLGIPKNPGY